MRKKTERPEVIVNKTAKILNFNKNEIEDEINKFIKDKKWQKIKSSNCFGIGNTSKKIHKILENN